MPPTNTLWTLKPQSEGKHLVLRNYLGAWLGIMAPREGRLVFIDGFAGPGEYEGGQAGSPMIALDVLEKHSYKEHFRAELQFLFLEPHDKRRKHLENLVAPVAARLGSRANISIRGGTFEESVTSLLDALECKGSSLAPAFVMVDPFGVREVPMSLLGRILANKKSELFVSFMYESINRHHTTSEFEPHLDLLFGTESWRGLAANPDSSLRKQLLLDLYGEQLRAAGAKYVRRIEMWDKGRLVYVIYFATGNRLGFDRMKSAMWKADPVSGVKFTGGDPQQTLFGVDLSILESELRAEFGGAEVPIETLHQWMMTDATLFYSGQLKKTLKNMEKAGTAIVTLAPNKRKNGTFPDGTFLTVAST